MRTFRLVILESPYFSPDPKMVKENLAYARACVLDCLQRGEAPFASHLLYTQDGIFDDRIPQERELGILAGLAWGDVADATVVYTDRGISSGMRQGISKANEEFRPVEFRRLNGSS